MRDSVYGDNSTQPCKNGGFPDHSWSLEGRQVGDPVSPVMYRVCGRQRDRTFYKSVNKKFKKMLEGPYVL